VVWAKGKGIGYSTWTKEELGLSESRGIANRKSNRVREAIYALARKKGIRNMKGASKEEWDGLLKKVVETIIHSRTFQAVGGG